MATLFPITKWAQRKNLVYLTVEVPGEDAKELSVKYDDGQVVDVSCEANGKKYVAHLELKEKIIPAESSHRVGRTVEMQLKKAEEKWWDKLVSTGKNPRIMCDWDKWVDEDEVDEAPEVGDWGGLGDLGGMGGMGGMPGMPGMGGMGDMSDIGGFGGMDGMGDADSDDEVESDTELELGEDREVSKGENAPADAAPTEEVTTEKAAPAAADANTISAETTGTAAAAE